MAYAIPLRSLRTKAILFLFKRVLRGFYELRSNLVFGPSESSGDQIGLCYLDTVFELYSGYHLGQIIEAA